MAAAARISVNIHELVSKNITLVSKKGKNTSQTGKQFGKYFYCFCLAEALLAEAEVEKTPECHHLWLHSNCNVPSALSIYMSPLVPAYCH